MTPYIEANNIAEGQSKALVTGVLPGLTAEEQPTSYSGFITVNETTDSHIFFWFFPKDLTSPVSVWLQGGPGSSSMLGLFEINGPISAVDDGNGNVVGEIHPYAWTNKASMIYIDQPVGTGFKATIYYMEMTFELDFQKDSVTREMMDLSPPKMRLDGISTFSSPNSSSCSLIISQMTSLSLVNLMEVP